MTTEQTQQLSENIQVWLFSKPDQDDILYYLRHIPEADYDFIDRAMSDAATGLVGEKDAFFLKAQTFTDQLSETDQFDYIFKFAHYNAPSVIQSLQAKHPEIGLTPLAATINQWAKDYLDKWESVFYFGSGLDFIRLQPYAHSFLQMNASAETITSLSESFEQKLELNTKNWDSGTGLTAPEVEEELKLLQTLTFLPDEYIRALLNPAHLEEKIALYSDFVTVLLALEGYGYVEAQANPEYFDQNIWKNLKELLQVSFLADIDAQWIVDHKKKDLTDLYAEFASIWSFDNIWSGKTESDMLGHIAGINPDEKKLLLQHLTYFLAHSTVVEYLLEPLMASQVIPQFVAAIAREEGNTASATILEQVIPENRVGVEPLLKTIRSIYQAL